MQTDATLEATADAASTALFAPMQTFDLYSYCYAERQPVITELSSILTLCGGWMLERKTLSPVASEFLFEVELTNILELYGSLVALGIELTRTAHTALTDLCTCHQHRSRSSNCQQIVTLRLEISFLADVTLHSMLMTGSNLA